MRRLRRFLLGRAQFVLSALLLFALFVLLAARLPFLLAPIAAVERVLALTALLCVAVEASPPEYKLPKALLCTLLPWMGAVVCLLFLFRPRETDFGHTMSEDPPRDFPLGVLSEKLSGLPSTGCKSVSYLPVGRTMYERLLPDLKRARRSIYLEFYIIDEGVFFGDVLKILTERATKGADVRLIFDGFGCGATLPPSFDREMERRGIKTCCFGPLRFPSRDIERRDHRKLVVIDGEIGYTGGLNLADEYIGERVRFGHWKDAAVRVTGGAAAALSALFVHTWNRLDGRHLSPPEISDGKIPCAIISDVSEPTSLRMGRQALLSLIAGARERLYLTTPYLAPDSALMGAIAGAALSGVDVRLMIPHIPDKRLPFLLTRSYAAELEKSGVKVLEYTDGFLHAKTVVADGTALVSSYNLDFRSLYLQAECGIAIRQRAFSDDVAADFLSVWQSGTPLPVAGRAKTLLCRLLRLIAPLI